ncbi:hypothetical protein AURDEDRAFT_165985 [Auricularia subglabra TFB-10046 SS5]|nr:hypothetical protein AURDEDRAFT_165985 [Auricularia subglabra TFB-10046 SS5]
MFDKLLKADVGHVPKVKRTDAFPYRSGDYACFACEKEGQDTTDTLAERFCARCDPPVELNWNNAPRVLEHMAGHILFDRSLDRSLDLCGFCLSPAPQCLFYLKKGKGADSGMQVDFRQNKSRGCQRAVPFKYGFASKSTASSPCSNVPIVCPRCPPGQPAIWWYNFVAHFRRVHPSANPNDYSELYELSASETEGMRKLWDARSAPRRASRKTMQSELKISDDHRAVVPHVSQAGDDQLLIISDDEVDSEPDADLDGRDLSGETSESDAEPEEELEEPECDPPSLREKSPFVHPESAPEDLEMEQDKVVAVAVIAPDEVPEPVEEQGRGCRRKAKRSLPRDACICNKQVTDAEIAAHANIIDGPAPARTATDDAVTCSDPPDQSLAPHTSSARPRLVIRIPSLAARRALGAQPPPSAARPAPLKRARSPTPDSDEDEFAASFMRKRRVAAAWL